MGMSTERFIMNKFIEFIDVINKISEKLDKIIELLED